MWEICLLVFLVTVGFGVAILMTRKTKRANLTIIQQATDVNLEELAIKVARAVAKEIVKNLPRGIAPGRAVEEPSIRMDESLIPIAIEATATEANLDGMAKEEKAIDKDLKKSKGRLAGILKKRKGEDGSKRK